MDTNGSTPPEEGLWVMVEGRDAYVRVVGRGTFKVSGALREFGQSALARGARRIVFDMTQCQGMDSTFMGVIAGLASRSRREAGGAILMTHLSPKNYQLMATLGLDRLVETVGGEEVPEAPQDGGDLDRLALADEGKRATAQVMLEAHEALVEAVPDNLPKFKHVLQYLRDDLERKDASGA